MDAVHILLQKNLVNSKLNEYYKTTEWKHVRHIPEYGLVCWRGMEGDALKGNEAYGDPSDGAKPWASGFDIFPKAILTSSQKAAINK